MSVNKQDREEYLHVEGLHVKSLETVQNKVRTENLVAESETSLSNMTQNEY